MSESNSTVFFVSMMWSEHTPERRRPSQVFLHQRQCAVYGRLVGRGVCLLNHCLRFAVHPPIGLADETSQCAHDFWLAHCGVCNLLPCLPGGDALGVSGTRSRQYRCPESQP